MVLIALKPTVLIFEPHGSDLCAAMRPGPLMAYDLGAYFQLAALVHLIKCFWLFYVPDPFQGNDLLQSTVSGLVILKQVVLVDFATIYLFCNKWSFFSAHSPRSTVSDKAVNARISGLFYL